jgi:hypothetical protein
VTLSLICELLLSFLLSDKTCTSFIFESFRLSSENIESRSILYARHWTSIVKIISLTVFERSITTWHEYSYTLITWLNLSSDNIYSSLLISVESVREKLSEWYYREKIFFSSLVLKKDVLWTSKMSSSEEFLTHLCQLLSKCECNVQKKANNRRKSAKTINYADRFSVSATLLHQLHHDVF